MHNIENIKLIESLLLQTGDEADAKASKIVSACIKSIVDNCSCPEAIRAFIDFAEPKGLGDRNISIPNSEDNYAWFSLVEKAKKEAEQIYREQIIYLHKMTENEIRECKRIESIVKEATGYTGGRAMSIGNPISKYSNADGSSRYLAGGDCYRSFFCISEGDDINFHYYLVEVGDRGMFGLRDFDKIFKKFYIKYYEDITMYDAFLYELTRRVCEEIDVKFENFVIHLGIFAKAEYHQGNDRYSLHLLHGYGCGMATDYAAYCLEYSKPVFLKIKCPSCNIEFFFDENNIPVGKVYECSCPKCGMLLKRKRC